MHERADSGETGAKVSRVIPAFPEAAEKYLGLCRRMGRVTLGAGKVLAEVTGGRPPIIVIVAADASERTVKQLSDKCAYRGIRIARTKMSGTELAHLMGKEGALGAVSAADPGLCGQMLRLMDAEEQSQP